MCNILLTTDNTFTIHLPNLITVEFLMFIKSQFTENAENVLHRLIVDCRAISKVPRPL